MSFKKIPIKCFIPLTLQSIVLHAHKISDNMTKRSKNICRVHYEGNMSANTQVQCVILQLAVSVDDADAPSVQ